MSNLTLASHYSQDIKWNHISIFSLFSGITYLAGNYGRKNLQARVPKALGFTGWVTTPRWRLWQTQGTKQLFSFPYRKVCYEPFKKMPSPLKIFKNEEKAKNCVWAYYGHERVIKPEMESVELNGLVTWNQIMFHPKACHCNGTG